MVQTNFCNLEKIIHLLFQSSSIWLHKMLHINCILPGIYQCFLLYFMQSFYDNKCWQFEYLWVFLLCEQTFKWNEKKQILLFCVGTSRKISFCAEETPANDKNCINKIQRRRHTRNHKNEWRWVVGFYVDCMGTLEFLVHTGIVWCLLIVLNLFFRHFHNIWLLKDESVYIRLTCVHVSDGYIMNIPLTTLLLDTKGHNSKHFTK